MPALSRRSFLFALTATPLAGGLAACNSTSSTPPPAAQLAPAASPAIIGEGISPHYATMYAAIPDEPHPVPAINLTQIDPAFLRREVDYLSSEPPGTIIVDPYAHYLYFILPGGRAMRYGVGVGRDGFSWSGVATVNSKQQWPDWYPPREMLDRQPELEAQMVELQSGIGMPGGARNPLAARALYLWQNNKDTLYRIHGTYEPWTIGKSVSSGCIRMINQDVIDLYDRVEVGARVIVVGAGGIA